ncbi:zinc metallochaperone AztD [Phytoactinopolyspora alkaliphila]|uniref:zinc metallochaperone AztD n=1 Tax=Phytoactinopolyspora alkaliphila TaxID=1783498 RepID=UPI001C20AA2D|nr:zinc metallochaperone AztD [Phytoactinopolyspora alkaliphila]
MTIHSHTLREAMQRSPRRTATRLFAGVALSGLVLAGCAGDDQDDAADETSELPAEIEETDDATEPETSEDEATDGEATEVSARSPRLAVTYDGGIQVLDATTLDVIEDIALDGFNRLNPAGDERHLFVSTTGGFQVLDMGTWGEPHGDHSHFYTAAPDLTDVIEPAQTPGHVVVHHGRTALFDDGTGEVWVFDSGDAADAGREMREYVTPSAHHGVAVELSDGTLVVSEGDEEARTGIRVLDADGEEIAASDDCPGVHGEAVAANETVVVGCEDGVLVYADGEITKVDSPDDYGRIGNQAGSENSPIVLGDYKSDPDADLERPTRVALVDTRTAELSLVDLPASYTFRSLARGDDGEGLVLGTDGQIHVIDPETAELVDSIPVMEEWEEPTEWQQPRPTITMLDGTAYVTDPSTNTVHAVDIPTGEVWNSVELDVTPNEMTGVTGDAVEGVSSEHSGDDEHDDEHEHDEGHEHDEDDEHDEHEHDEDDEHDH